VRLLVHGRSLLTGRLDAPVVENGGALIEGSAIVAIGSSSFLREAYHPEEEIGGPDRIVLPGLISAHQHGGGISSILLGCGDAMFEHWLIKMYGVPPLDPYVDTVYHALRFVECGITTTVHSHYTRDPHRYGDEAQAIIRAYRDVGLRLTFAPCFMDRGRFVYGDEDAFLRTLPPALSAASHDLGGAGVDLSDYLGLVATLSRDADREWCRIMYGPVAPQWCSEVALRAMSAAGAATVGLHTHLLESRAQRAYLDQALGGSVVAWLDDLGLVSNATSFAHGVWLQPDEIELLAHRGAHVVHNPSCNLRLGNGYAPVSQLLQAGASVALGTDDMTLDDDEDLLREMRLAGVLARAQGHWISPAALLHAATARGAAAAGFSDLVGTLEPGMRADVVLLDARALDGATDRPDVDDLTLVVGRGSAPAVASVLIGGRVVFHNGQHVGVDRQAVVSQLRGIWREQSHSDDAARSRAAAAEIAAMRDAYSAGRVV
jgi:cytosine/adenosine deaminase-related metal-dependent hydrolase